MAAYAAFKHVELYNVGKAKKRVLRPPGGGSSDIFGSEMPQTPRNVKNRMVSNIFAAEKDNGVKNNVRQGAHRFYFIGDAPRRGQKTVDSHSRLFGEPSRPITPGKNHMKSSIPFGGQNSEAAAAQKLLTTNGHYNGKSGSVSSASSSVSSSTENLKMNNGSRSVFRNMSKGNPVTGEGYKAGGNDFHQRQESSNGGTPVINKNRVPPGGYSSGLW
ncbi:microtubule-associated protein Jupiter isoform X2 [Drosophila gunungcola]|uniref:microtubule-associated protein Jupiter isoform X5 n=1 Tax=Drosophila elegans TaxID=30023 RepID=UPI001BC85236|nr:microtubule-associated protein Jupiter isoform X5 [Drosophila elegans]XP_052837992.1 microtubule-associated protein Jupiter isoform X2 [Drosophila gunungcola]